MHSLTGVFGSQRNGFRSTSFGESQVDIGYSGYENEDDNRRTDSGYSQKRRAESAEPPCIPLTIKMLLAAFKRNDLTHGTFTPYENAECGVISLVGWVTELELRPIEFQFQLADGTTTKPLCVKMIVDKRQESWLLNRAETKLQAGALVRVIGQPEIEDNEPLLRAIHFRCSSPEEAMYFHIIEVVWTYTQLTANKDRDTIIDNVSTPSIIPRNVTNDSTPSIIPSNISTEFESAEENNFSIPVTKDISTKYKRSSEERLRDDIINFIRNNRKDESGVAIDDIANNFKKTHTGNEIRSTVNEMERMLFCFETIDDKYDCISPIND